MKPKPRTILMFDEDYESMRDVKEHIEEEWGWTAVLSAEPWVLTRLRNERFDLLMVDVMIHEKSFDGRDNEVENVQFEGVSWLRTGLEFLRRQRRGDYVGENSEGTPADVPVILLSAVDSYSVDQDLDIGEYVQKPFQLEDIMTKIQGVLKE